MSPTSHPHTHPDHTLSTQNPRISCPESASSSYMGPIQESVHMRTGHVTKSFTPRERNGQGGHCLYVMGIGGDMV